MLPEAPGMQVTASVRLVRPLGQGGMGTVWIGHHALLKVDVAVKFMASSMTGDEGAARFTREAAAAARVKSPHVAQVLDHGALPDGRLFIVMELLEGEDLSTCLRRVNRLPVTEVLRIVTDVARALARAHERGIVHRDIKPANIFLCDVGTTEPFVKVLDFGVAKEITKAEVEQTATGVAIGTPGYMSPEQLVGSRTVDHRADVWALAVVTYRALTGEAPYHGESAGALALAIFHGPPPNPALLDPTLPAALTSFFVRAFARAIEDRFQSATELAAALAAAAKGEIVVQPQRPVSVRTMPMTPVNDIGLADTQLTPTTDEGPTETSHAAGDAGSVSPHTAPGAARRGRFVFALAIGVVALAGVGLVAANAARSAGTSGSPTAAPVSAERGKDGEPSTTTIAAPGSAVAEPVIADAAPAASARTPTASTPTASATTSSAPAPRPRASVAPRPRFPIE